MKVNNLLLLIAFALALTLSAGLLFNIQPMMGKMLLPRVGGAPAVWNVAMAFFQISLLTGYLIAHALSKFSPRIHALGYIVLLALAALVLPISLPMGWQPDESANPAFSVFLVLILSVALPFIALSLSAPTLQRLFASTTHPDAKDPYFLYVASNLGSFAGLLAYPLWLEPRYDIRAQTEIWQSGYYVLMALAILCILLRQRSATEALTTPPAPQAAPLAPKQKAFWVLLAFIPSSLTLGVTTHITTDIAATPMLWAATLALYLLTFILAFAQRGEKIRQLAVLLAPWMAVLGLVLTLSPLHLVFTEIALHLALFTVIALACHSLLAKHRPAASQLTSFYLWLSVGGALGGAFNAFVAPLIFSYLTEYPLVLLLALIVIPVERTKHQQMLIGLVLLTAFAAYGQGVLIQHTNGISDNQTIGLFIGATLLLISQTRNRPLMAILGLALIVLKMGLSGDTLYSGRDFFGTVSVHENNFDITDSDGKPTSIRVRSIDHGTTRHGIAIVDGPTPPIPTGYYSPSSPIAQTIRALNPQAVAGIGLGSGAINCHMAQGRHYTFIEIDPLVEQVARTYFDFLSACTPPTILIGDGRLKMAALPDHSFDLIVLDAFSSDSIPTHIVTEEAFALYLTKLRPGGAIALHITSRFFRLEPMLAALAHNLALSAVFGQNTILEATPTTIDFPTRWVVMAPDRATIDKLRHSSPQNEAMWRDLQADPAIRAWSDGYSNLISVMKLHPDPIETPLPKAVETR